MITGTATTYALTATALVLLIYVVYFCIWFMIIGTVAWALTFFFRPLMRIIKYGHN